MRRTPLTTKIHRQSIQLASCKLPIAAAQPRVDGGVRLRARVDGAADVRHVGLAETERQRQPRPVVADTISHVRQPPLRHRQIQQTAACSPHQPVACSRDDFISGSKTLKYRLGAATRHAPPADGSSTVAYRFAPTVKPSASVHGSQNRGGSTPVRGRVRSPHISGGRRWLSCRQPACL